MSSKGVELEASFLGPLGATAAMNKTVVHTLWGILLIQPLEGDRCVTESGTLALTPLLGSDAPRWATAAVEEGGGDNYLCLWLS